MINQNNNLNFETNFEIVEFDEVGSTMDIARELINSTQDRSKTIVITAKSQTKGRGRLDRTWISPKGNLYCSIVMFPENFKNLNQTTLNKLSFCFSVSIAESIEKLASKQMQSAQSTQSDLEIKCKWPNDIYINRKKISGILIQSVLNSNNTQIDGVIVGIGVNILTRVDEIISISLKDIGIEIEVMEFLEILLMKIEENIKIFYFDFERIKFKWMQRAYRLNEIVAIKKSDEQIVNGKFVDIDHHGNMMLEANDSKILVLYGDMI
jgi:BirA family transcriptional regulator, biotin operon repressor / biotin---[acetyl-CoA-carboxylase] ligase